MNPSAPTEASKILSLIYSNNRPTDLLALELIKNREDQAPFIGALLCIAMTTHQPELGNDILQFLSPQLTQQQITYTQERIDRGKVNEIFAPLVYEYFPRNIAVDITYTNFHRKGESAADFLCLDQGTHPDRETVFQDFKANALNYYIGKDGVSIPGLFPKEIEQLLQYKQEQKGHPNFGMMIIESIQSPELPDRLFEGSVEDLLIGQSYSNAYFPSYVFRFKGLKKLALPINSDSEIPEDWSALSSLNELRFSGEGHTFSNLDFLNHLPKLKQFYIVHNYLSHPGLLLRNRIVPMSDTINFRSTEGYELNRRGQIFVLPQATSLSIASALGKSILSYEEQETYFKLIIKQTKIKNLEKLPLDDLLALMNVSYASLRSVIQGQLDALCDQQKGIDTLDKNALLYIAGTPSRKKKEIKQKLAALNIPLTDNPNHAITHLLVCKAPKKYTQLQNRDFALISEQALYKLFQTDAPDFIEEAVQAGDTSISTNIQQFLYNDEISTIKVGIEMLKNGGVPDELIDPLLVVYKSCPDTKTRGEAKKLLLRHAPSEYLPLINDSQRFTNLNQRVRAQEINNKLEKIARTTSRGLAAKLSILFHLRFKKGLRYILYHFHEPSQERTQALQALMEGTHLNYSAGLGFTSWKDVDPESTNFYRMKTSAKFPADIAQHVPLIETANFHNCKFTSLPKDIGNLKDLKKLDLSYNFLGSIPKSIGAMTQLEHLDLQRNSFKTFPMQLKQLTHLKVLDLRYNQVDGLFVPVIIPDEIREALAGCEILDTF